MKLLFPTCVRKKGDDKDLQNRIWNPSYRDGILTVDGIIQRWYSYSRRYHPELVFLQ